MEQVTIEEAQTRLGDLMTAAANGETVIIVGDNQPAMRLMPLVPPNIPVVDMAGIYQLPDDPDAPVPPRHPKFGSAAGLIWMSEDFDEPLEDFAEYM
jgi:antitoxin (DNA-binding transcriptional repressor) of toxin-antitoxin stability system